MTFAPSTDNKNASLGVVADSHLFGGGKRKKCFDVVDTYIYLGNRW